MNSTPVRPASTIRLTAFVPPPPTPTTLITARKFPDWSLTLKVARPEAAVERAFCALRFRQETTRLLQRCQRPTFGAESQPQPSTLGFQPSDWARGNGDVDVAARAR